MFDKQNIVLLRAINPPPHQNLHSRFRPLGGRAASNLDTWTFYWVNQYKPKVCATI